MTVSFAVFFEEVRKRMGAGDVFAVAALLDWRVGEHCVYDRFKGDLLTLLFKQGAVDPACAEKMVLALLLYVAPDGSYFELDTVYHRLLWREPLNRDKSTVIDSIPTHLRPRSWAPVWQALCRIANSWSLERSSWIGAVVAV